MENDQIVEILEYYMEITEKQEETIHLLSELVHKQSREIQLLKNDELFSKSNT